MVEGFKLVCIPNWYLIFFQVIYRSSESFILISYHQFHFFSLECSLDKKCLGKVYRTMERKYKNSRSYWANGWLVSYSSSLTPSDRVSEYHLSELWKPREASEKKCLKLFSHLCSWPKNRWGGKKRIILTFFNLWKKVLAGKKGLLLKCSFQPQDAEVYHNPML